MIKNLIQRSSIKGTLIASALAVGLIAQAEISMATSWNGNDINLVGTAQLVSGNLQLNNAVAQAGDAWAVSPISTTNSFSTTFSFDLKNQNTLYYPTSGSPFVLPMADGITFALQGTLNTALGGGGAGIGADGLNAVGSAIQTWSNNRLGLFHGDPSDLTNTHINAAPFDMGAASEVSGNETVSYNASTHTLSMTGSVNGNSVSDSLNIDLNALFGPTMYAGFTGGTGLGSADQEITAWNGINSTPGAPVPEPGTIMLLGFGMAGLAVYGKRRQSSKA
jgi:hypothetical protein